MRGGGRHLLLYLQLWNLLNESVFEVIIDISAGENVARNSLFAVLIPSFLFLWRTGHSPKSDGSSEKCGCSSFGWVSLGTPGCWQASGIASPKHPEVINPLKKECFIGTYEASKFMSWENEGTWSQMFSYFFFISIWNIWEKMILSCLILSLIPILICCKLDSHLIMVLILNLNSIFIIFRARVSNWRSVESTNGSMYLVWYWIFIDHSAQIILSIQACLSYGIYHVLNDFPVIWKLYEISFEIKKSLFAGQTFSSLIDVLLCIKLARLASAAQVFKSFSCQTS